MNKIAIVYWSGTGNTEIMAQNIAEGAKEAGAETDNSLVGLVAQKVVHRLSLSLSFFQLEKLKSSINTVT